jgi:pimeloyl-ACP methyl ester carboxylesterase
MGLRQLRMSWHILFFQLSWLPERLAHKVIPRLWRDRELPGSDLTEDIANSQRALPARSHRKAAISCYRAVVRPTGSASAFADLNEYRFAAPRGRILHMQGALDGAVHVGYSDFLADALPDGSRVHIVSDGGHFLQVEHPEGVCAAIVGHVGRPR